MKIFWILVSGLMVLSLVLASCGPTAVEEEEEEEEEVVIGEEEEEEEEVVEVTGPKYGGWITACTPREIMDFDEVKGWQAAAYTRQVTNQDLLTGDWSKGPAGTNEIDRLDYGIYALQTGGLAESWEMPEVGHWIMHMRKGVHYSLDPNNEASVLVGGREFNANDAEFALNSYLGASTSYIYRAFPGLVKTASVKATDKYTLEIEVPVEYSLDAADMFFTFATVDVPKEVIDKYGDQSDWKNAVGTGPFILVDFIPGSAITLERNPNYWMKDPCGPGKGNQLPYVDGMKWLVIPDNSTRLAAIRTGKVDFRGLTSWDFVANEDAEPLLAANPELKYRTGLPGGTATGMRTDMEPFSDIRVRRAMIMAIDYQNIIDTLCAGMGEKLGYPQSYNSGYLNFVINLDDPDCPERIKETYTYNPEKAKELLAEAGYPDGFSTTVTCQNNPTSVDRMSVLKDMWAKVGIELSLNPLETGAHNSISRTRNYEGLIADVGIGGGNVMLRGNRLQGSAQTNMCMIDDPKVNEAYVEIKSLALTDWDEAGRLHRELMKYVMDQYWGINFPVASSYVIWWPWLKNFYGDSSVGYFNYGTFGQYAWIDQDLKATMGY